MGIKWKKKKEEDTSITTLREAYELLGIDIFPVTYDKVCTQFYIKTMASGLTQEQKDNYEAAKRMILSKLSANPFIQESPMKVGEENIEIGLKRESVLEYIKKRLLQIKCLKKRQIKIEEHVNMTEGETGFILLKRKKKIGKNKIHVVLLMLFISGIFISVLNILVQRQEMVITKSESIELLESQGVKIENKTITIAPENICNYTVQQKAYIPGINICILERNYLFSTKNILTRVSSQTAYKSEMVKTGDIIWKKVWENTENYIVDTALSGTWAGSFVIGDDDLKDAVLKITVTENGYIEGTLSFKLANLMPGKIEVAGKYDTSKNKFSIKGLDWIERPSLFVTPSLDGYYDYQKEALVSSEGSSAIFEIKNIESAQVSIFAPLLEGENAVYAANGKKHNIELGNLTQFTYSIENQTDESVEIIYTGITNKNIVNFRVKGNAVFEKADTFYVLKNHSATAEYLSTSITGVYNGTEWLSDEEYKAVYKIYFSETDEMFLADVTLTKPFVTIKETRVITFEDGGIRAKRIDVLSDKVEGDGTAFALMNYEEDKFYSEKNLILDKQAENNNLITIADKSIFE